MKLPGTPTFRYSILLAAALGGLVSGSALLKTRHLASIAETAAWQPVDFQMGRAPFDRIEFERSDAERLARLGATMQKYVHGDDAAAERGLLKALASEPDDSLARFYLGITRLRMGHPVAARDDLRRALDAGFHVPDASGDWWLALATLYCGDRTEGYRLLERVVASESEHAAQSQIFLDRLDTLAQKDSI